jgi:hypothetical protein
MPCINLAVSSSRMFQVLYHLGKLSAVQPSFPLSQCFVSDVPPTAALKTLRSNPILRAVWCAAFSHSQGYLLTSACIAGDVCSSRDSRQIAAKLIDYRSTISLLDAGQ